MSAQVDVLAVMDDCTDELEKQPGCYYTDAARLQEARAAVAALIAERDALRGLIEELLDTELAELACCGSMAPVEDVLGRMQAAVATGESA